MIMPLISLVLVVPMLIGIASVDINGEKTSIREFLKSDLMVNITNTVKSALPSNAPEQELSLLHREYHEKEKEPENITYLVNMDLIESGKAIDSLNKSIAEGVTFLLFQVKDFGVWLGMSTAPFHYLLAVIIAFSLLFPNVSVFVVGFFYIIIKEHKEIRNDIHDARVRAKMK